MNNEKLITDEKLGELTALSLLFVYLPWILISLGINFLLTKFLTPEQFFSISGLGTSIIYIGVSLVVALCLKHVSKKIILYTKLKEQPGKEYFSFTVFFFMTILFLYKPKMPLKEEIIQVPNIGSVFLQSEIGIFQSAKINAFKVKSSQEETLKSKLGNYNCSKSKDMDSCMTSLKNQLSSSSLDQILTH